MLGGFDEPDRGQCAARRPGSRRHAALSSPDQHDVPVLRAVPAYDGLGRTSPSASGRIACRRPMSRPASRRCWPSSSSTSSPSASRTSFPAASASAWRSPARMRQEAEGAAARRAARRLDKKLREETQFELMRPAGQQLGMTFLIVTHDQEEAMTVADRIAVMKEGQHRPGGDAGRDLRAAELALRRRLHRRHQPDRGQGRRKSEQGSARLRLRRHRRDASRSTRRSMRRSAPRPGCAIRPEKVRISARRRPTPPSNALTGRGLGHRLSRRRLDLPCPPADRRHRQGATITNATRASSSGRSPGKTRSG